MSAFAHPWLLPLAAAVPIVLGWLTARRNRAQRVPALIAAARRPRLAQLAPGLALAGVAVAWVAAAGPQHVFFADSPAVGRDVVVLLDVSASMAAGGPGHDALAAARRAVRTLAAERSGDRLALVAFGARAAVVSPLTRDHATLLALMSGLAPTTLGPRTAIGDALAVALELLGGRAGGGAGIVLVTDGENNAGTLDPVTAAAVAAERGIRVDTVAVAGSAAGGESGAVNEALLRAIARKTGGRFVRAQNAAALAGAFADLARLQPSRQPGVRQATAEDRSAVPSGWAACLLVAAAIADAAGRRAWA